MPSMFASAPSPKNTVTHRPDGVSRLGAFNNAYIALPMLSICKIELCTRIRKSTSPADPGEFSASEERCHAMLRGIVDEMMAQNVTANGVAWWLYGYMPCCTVSFDDTPLRCRRDSLFPGRLQNLNPSDHIAGIVLRSTSPW